MRGNEIMDDVVKKLEPGLNGARIRRSEDIGGSTMIATVTFDFDGTLVLSPFWRLHLRPWLEGLACRHGGTLAEVWAPVRELGEFTWRHGDWVGAFDWAALIRTALGETLPLPVQPSGKAVRDLLMPHVNETWLELANLGVRCALVTNGFYPYQIPYVRALGWDHWFDRIVTPDTSGTAKPDPRVFLGLGPVICHVGDRPEHDAVAARRAGVVSVQIGPKPRIQDRPDLMAAQIEPDITLDDIRALPSTIRHMLRHQMGQKHPSEVEEIAR